MSLGSLPSSSDEEMFPKGELPTSIQTLQAAEKTVKDQIQQIVRETFPAMDPADRIALAEYWDNVAQKLKNKVSTTENLESYIPCFRSLIKSNPDIISKPASTAASQVLTVKSDVEGGEAVLERAFAHMKKKLEEGLPATPKVLDTQFDHIQQLIGKLPAERATFWTEKFNLTVNKIRLKQLYYDDAFLRGPDDEVLFLTKLLKSKGLSYEPADSIRLLKKFLKKAAEEPNIKLSTPSEMDEMIKETVEKRRVKYCMDALNLDQTAQKRAMMILQINRKGGQVLKDIKKDQSIKLDKTLKEIDPAFKKLCHFQHKLIKATRDNFLQKNDIFCPDYLFDLIKNGNGDKYKQYVTEMTSHYEKLKTNLETRFESSSIHMQKYVAFLVKYKDRMAFTYMQDIMLDPREQTGVCLAKVYEWIKTLLPHRGIKIRSEEEYRKMFGLPKRKNSEENIEDIDIGIKTVQAQSREEMRGLLDFKNIEAIRRKYDTNAAPEKFEARPSVLSEGALIVDKQLQQDGIVMSRLTLDKVSLESCLSEIRNEDFLFIFGHQMVLHIMSDKGLDSHVLNIEIDPKNKIFSIKDPNNNWYYFSSHDEFEGALKEMLEIHYPYSKFTLYAFDLK